MMFHQAIVTILSLAPGFTAGPPVEDLKQVRVDQVRTAEELFALTEKLYAAGAVSGMDYQNARLRMLAVKIEAAPRLEDRVAAMNDRVQACAARLKYLTTPGIALTPIEAEGVVPAARVDLAVARFAVTGNRDDREQIVRETLRDLDANPLDPKVEATLSRAERLELKLVRLSLRARLLALLDE